MFGRVRDGLVPDPEQTPALRPAAAAKGVLVVAPAAAGVLGRLAHLVGLGGHVPLRRRRQVLCEPSDLGCGHLDWFFFGGLFSFIGSQIRL